VLSQNVDDGEKKRAPKAPEDLEEEAINAEATLTTQNQTLFNIEVNEPDASELPLRSKSNAKATKDNGSRITPSATDNFTVSETTSRRHVANIIGAVSLVLLVNRGAVGYLLLKQLSCQSG
jgi:hypothetical protein